MHYWQRIGYKSYNDYIVQAPEWQQTIKRYQKAHRVIYCWICDATIYLQLHHEDYQNMPKEDVWRDLVALCSDCHALVHFDEKGRRTPLYAVALRARRKQLRRKYVLTHLRSSTMWYFTKISIYRYFHPLILR